MIKRLEESDLNSCWNESASGTRRVFVLLERDIAAPGGHSSLGAPRG